MKENNFSKYPILFSLYIAQSVPMSFFSTVVPVIMRQENFSLQSIGLLQLVKLPWLLKFLWAPLVDGTAHSNRQLKLWILASELVYALIILFIGFFSLNTDFELIIALMLIAFTASATQDIATDAFAILNLKPRERAYGNSLQSAGSFVGSLLGTGVLLIAYHYFGWTVLMGLLALFVLVAVAPVLTYRHAAALIESKVERIKFADIFLFFGLKKNLLQIPILMIAYAGIIGILSMLKPYLVDLSYSTAQIGLMSGVFGTSIAAVVSIFGGYIVKKIQSGLALSIFPVFSLSAGIYFSYLADITPSTTQLYIGIALVWASYGLMTVAIFTRAMEYVRPGREGTDFTIQIVLTHLSSMLVAVFSGKIAQTFGYSGLFRIEAVISVITLLLIAFLIYREKRSLKTDHK